ncbi:hypothetical protein OHR68_31660 [Spirillospora sp. NBC_00431]
MIRNSRRMGVLAVAGAVAIAPVISGCGAGAEPQSAAPTQLTDSVNVSVPKDKPENPQIVLRNVFLLGPRPGEPIPPGSSLPLYGVVINQVKGSQDRLVSVSSTLFGKAKIDGDGLVLPPAAQDGTGSPVNLLGKPSAPKTPPAPTAPEGQKTKKPGATPSARQPQDTPTTRPGGAGTTSEPTGAGTTPGPNTSPPSGNAGGTQETPPPTTPDGKQALVILPGLTQELLASSRVPVRMQFEKAGAVDFQVPIVPQQGEYSTYPLAVHPPATPQPGSPNTGGPSQSPGTTPSGATPEQSGAPGHGSPQPGTSQAPAGGGESPGASGH